MSLPSNSSSEMAPNPARLGVPVPKFRLVSGPKMGENLERITPIRTHSGAPPNCDSSDADLRISGDLQPSFHFPPKLNWSLSNSESIEPHHRPGTSRTPPPLRFVHSSQRILSSNVQYVVVGQQSSVGGPTTATNRSIFRLGQPGLHGAQQQQQQFQQNQQQQDSSGDQMSMSRMVAKCARFFTSLINRSRQSDHEQQQQQMTGGGEPTAVKLKRLVNAVIYGSISPELFISGLKEALQSQQAQPHLLPFLEKTLPSLRRALKNGELTIEGVGPLVGNSHPARPINVQQQTSSIALIGRPQTSTIDTHVRTDIQPAPSTLYATCKKPDESPIQCTSVERDRPSSDLSETRSLGGVEPSLLNTTTLLRRTAARIGQADGDALRLVSKAAEIRLRLWLTRLAVVAEHRLQTLRLNPIYSAIFDARQHLRFLGELDRLEQRKKEDREKEALMRLAKLKSKDKADKDTFREKAKEMQRVEQEAARNRDANAAAAAALGSRPVKRSWNETTGVASPQHDTGGAGGPGHAQQQQQQQQQQQPLRVRTRRVNLRDLQLVLAQDASTRQSPISYRLSVFKSVSNTDSTS